jgi:hypothetical protein
MTTVPGNDHPTSNTHRCHELHRWRACTKHMHANENTNNRKYHLRTNKRQRRMPRDPVGLGGGPRGGRGYAAPPACPASARSRACGPGTHIASSRLPLAAISRLGAHAHTRGVASAAASRHAATRSPVAVLQTPTAPVASHPEMM